MDSDAKLGLLAGLAGVLVVAVVYFQKPAPETAAAGQPEPTALTGTALAAPGAPESPSSGRTPALPTSYQKRGR